MYTKERYYTDEDPVKSLEDLLPMESEKVIVEAEVVEEKPKPKRKTKKTTSKKVEKPKKTEEIKERKFHKNIFIVVVVQSPEKKINEQGNTVPVEPVLELKSILVEEHETFKDVMAKYEKLPTGFIIGNDFYPLQTKGDIIRMVELTQEEIAELSERAKQEMNSK